MSSHIHVANRYWNDVYVFPAQSMGWLIADILTDVAMFAMGVGKIRAAVMGAQLPAMAKTVSDLWKFLEIAGQLLGGTVGAGSIQAEGALEIINAFKEISIKVPPGEYQDVRESSLLDYFSASGLASLLGAETITLIMMTDNGRQRVNFDTHIDHSWIAASGRVVRSRYGTLWQESPNDGLHQWETA